MNDTSSASFGVAIYVIADLARREEVINDAMGVFSPVCEEVHVIAPRAVANQYEAYFAHFGNVYVFPFEGDESLVWQGWKEGLNRVFERDQSARPVVLSGAHVFGPFRPIGPGSYHISETASVMAPYWTSPARDSDYLGKNGPDQVPSLDLTIFAPKLLQDPDFQRFWHELRAPENEENQRESSVALNKIFLKGGHEVEYAVPREMAGSAKPATREPYHVVRGGAPCLPLALFRTDPLVHDLTATDVKSALNYLRHHAPSHYTHMVAFGLRHLPLREFCTIADEYAIFQTDGPGATALETGPIAVFIHAFYADMMEEFWELAVKIPGQVLLYITTATRDEASQISAFLDGKDWPSEQYLVRVVEQNRGRDMSSLFITWRDIALSGKHEIALRLHSKRTPQVEYQVGQSFKAHLFENLVASPEYVQNLLHRMVKEPDIGLVIPPLIHVGFGTLGHSWFNNKQSLLEIAAELDMEFVPDDTTPVAAYGTMYWFRPDALFKMFNKEWNWSDYNPEPHHIDGGLAHVQERLIAYCVQDRGYRVLQVMTPEQAARNYVKLEFKAQMFASFCMSNNIVLQKMELSRFAGGLRARVFRVLRDFYGHALRAAPWSRKYLRPFKDFALAVLTRR